jgi:hypothetical protein
MRKLLLAFFLCSAAFTGFSQCLNTTSATAVNAPGTVGGTATSISLRPIDYLPVNGCVIGYVYKMTSTLATDFFTVRSGSFDGPVVTFGVQPLNFTAATSGTYYVHLNNNASCGTSYTVSRNATVTLITATSTPAGCFNTTTWSSMTAPATIGGTSTATSLQGSDYTSLSSVVAGNSYKITSTVATDYISVRSGTRYGAIVAAGVQPLNFSAPIGGTYYVHVNTNANCGTDGNFRNLTTTRIHPVCSGTPTGLGTTVTSNAGPVCPATSFQLSLPAIQEVSEVVYQWEVSTAGTAGPFTAIAGKTAVTATITGQAQNSWYRLAATCTGVGTTAYSGPVNVSQQAAANCYCIPTYQYNNQYGYINSVLLGTINNVTGRNADAPNNYYSYTTAPASNQTTNLSLGSSQTITINAQPTGGYNAVAAWIDYNADGDFYDDGEKLGGVFDAPNGNVIFNFTVPATATTGATRLRIREAYGFALTDPCAVIPSNGETEDYTVNIQVPCAEPPSTVITPNGPTIFCQGGSVTLTASGAVSYLWNTGATSASIVVNTGGTFSVVGTSAAGCTGGSTPTNVTVTPQPAPPTLACYQQTTFNNTTCQWVITGTQPAKPTSVNCWDNYQFNATTCTWLNTGVQPSQPTAVNCWDNYQFNTTSCSWVNNGTQPAETPRVNCWDNYQFNNTSCSWVNIGTQPIKPTAVHCWDNYQFSAACSWVNIGTQPAEPPRVNCWDRWQFNNTSCSWVNTGTQTTKPTSVNCWDNYEFNSNLCSWVNIGTQPIKPPAVNCWDNYQFNNATCLWVNNGIQQTKPTNVNCWDNYQFNTTTCAWVNNGSQPVKPTTACYVNGTFNPATCTWEPGSQPPMPARLNCWDNFQFNAVTCAWVNTGTQPIQPAAVNCWDNYQFNTTSCSWVKNGKQPTQPTAVNCWDNFQFNSTLCSWVNMGSQAVKPSKVNCWDNYQFNTTTCAWVNNGTQQTRPTRVNCWDDYLFNTTTCAWVNNGVQPTQPTTVNCWDNYQFNTTTCSWVNNGTQPTKPTRVNCWDDYIFNTTTCNWINNGSQPTKPTAVNCWDNYQFNTTTCTWVNNGTQPVKPTTACYVTGTFNTTTCAWEPGTQPPMPARLNCWDNFQFNPATCAWVNNGVQPIQPTAVNCWDNYQFNTTSCSWVNNGTQQTKPAAVNCWDNYQFNTSTCSWVNNGTQQTKPTAVNCWDNYQFNTTTCSWVNNGTQQTKPPAVNCWDNYQFNTTTCSWVNLGSQAVKPSKVNCWDNYQFNTNTCSWVNNGTQPTQATAVNCWDNYQFNTSSCSWVNLGSQAVKPAKVNCWDNYQFNTSTCAWVNNGVQPAKPAAVNCWDDYQFNTSSCSWVNMGTTTPAQVSPCFIATLVNTPVYNSVTNSTTFTYNVCGKGCGNGLGYIAFITAGPTNIVAAPSNGSVFRTAVYSYDVRVPVSVERGVTTWGIKFERISRPGQQGIKRVGECDVFTFRLSGNRTAADIATIEFKAGPQVTTQTTAVGCGSSSNLISSNTSQVQKQDKEPTPGTARVNVSAFPNPYTDKVKFVIQSPVSGQASLELFNMSGQKIQTVFKGQVAAGIAQAVEYKVPPASRTNLMYVLKIGDQRSSGILLLPN